MTIAQLFVSDLPPVCLAPLAGITDRPFRDLVTGFGASLVVSEMVASQEIVQARPGTREKAELGLGAGKTSVQLAGRDPYWIGEAAKYVADQGAAIIDINMGCPAKKVVGGLSGSALMREPDRALQLIEAVVEAVSVPVTLKMRLGWDHDSLNAPDLARRAEAAGIHMVTVHGRTRCQFYKGSADWDAVAAVKQTVDIPVIVNGDITCADTAARALEQSGADGVMIGRGAQGQPWLLAQVAAALAGKTGPEAPGPAEFAAMVAEHYMAMLGFYGEDLGLRVARKHLGWYMDQAATPADLRGRILRAKSTTEVLSLLPEALSQGPGAAARERAAA